MESRRTASVSPPRILWGGCAQWALPIPHAGGWGWLTWGPGSLWQSHRASLAEMCRKWWKLQDLEAQTHRSQQPLLPHRQFGGVRDPPQIGGGVRPTSWWAKLRVCAGENQCSHPGRPCRPQAESPRRRTARLSEAPILTNYVGPSWAPRQSRFAEMLIRPRGQNMAPFGPWPDPCLFRSPRPGLGTGLDTGWKFSPWPAGPTHPLPLPTLPQTRSLSVAS